MSEKRERNIKSRIVHKHDVEANWLKATTFVPLQGEIIIYDKDKTYSYERIKVGDGSTLVSSLPFIDEHLEDVVNTKIGTEAVFGDDGTVTAPATGIYKIEDDISTLATLVGDTPVSEQIKAVLITVDEELSEESTNPVQNKLVTAAIANLNILVGDTPVSEQIEQYTVPVGEEIYALQEAVIEIENINSELSGITNEISALKDDAALINNKIDKVEGMGLSENSFSDYYKDLLDANASSINKLGQVVSTNTIQQGEFAWVYGNDKHYSLIWKGGK